MMAVVFDTNARWCYNAYIILVGFAHAGPVRLTHGGVASNLCGDVFGGSNGDSVTSTRWGGGSNIHGRLGRFNRGVAIGCPHRGVVGIFRGFRVDIVLGNSSRGGVGGITCGSVHQIILYGVDGIARGSVCQSIMVKRRGYLWWNFWYQYCCSSWYHL